MTEGEIVFIIEGRERVGMSCMGFKIGELLHSLKTKSKGGGENE